MPRREDVKKVLIIGSGPIVIGQACEFDYSGTQACKALRKLGYRIVLVNSNPATIMTDPALEVARRFAALGFGIRATRGTQEFLARNGVSAEVVLKMHEGRPHIVDAITNRAVQL